MKVNSVNKKIRMHIKVPKVTTESIYSIHNFQTSRGKERKFRVGSEAGRGKLNPSKRQELKKQGSIEKWDKVQNKMVEK